LHISLPVASRNREVAPGRAVSAANRWEEGLTVTVAGLRLA